KPARRQPRLGARRQLPVPPAMGPAARPALGAVSAPTRVRPVTPTPAGFVNALHGPTAVGQHPRLAAIGARPYDRALTVTCSQCGEENGDRARFCSACGSALTGAQTDSRKVVTILFSDVTGSTSLREQLDPEALPRVMGRFFDLGRTVVARHGGTVEKFVGDALMAVFGVPQVHEDDALRAVRAAVDLVGELEAVNDELEASYGVRLALRTGLDTGEVAVG